MTHNEFSDTINFHASSLRLHALNFTRDTEDANDLLQDTLLKATRFFSKSEEGTNIKGWLFVIMKPIYYADAFCPFPGAADGLNDTRDAPGPGALWVLAKPPAMFLLSAQPSFFNSSRWNTDLIGEKHAR